jgi:hypothetical protein
MLFDLISVLLDAMPCIRWRVFLPYAEISSAALMSAYLKAGLPSKP